MAETPLKLLAVFAHPDDESMGMGSTFIKYAREGVETSLVCATRGERGWNGPPGEFPGLQGLGNIREAELRASCDVLGIRNLEILDYIDGDLDQAPVAEVVGRISAAIRRIRPQVVITFDPSGAYGHPDHIAISQFTCAAVVTAADASCADPQNQPPHRVDKLYYVTLSPELYDAYLNLFGDIYFDVDGVQRQAVKWFDWASTTLIDGSQYWQEAWQAVACHQSQLAGYGDLTRLTPADHRTLWGPITYYRVYSLVNGGRQVETDLFAGLRG